MNFRYGLFGFFFNLEYIAKKLSKMPETLLKAYVLIKICTDSHIHCSLEIVVTSEFRGKSNCLSFALELKHCAI